MYDILCVQTHHITILMFRYCGRIEIVNGLLVCVLFIFGHFFLHTYTIHTRHHPTLQRSIIHSAPQYQAYTQALGHLYMHMHMHKTISTVNRTLLLCMPLPTPQSTPFCSTLLSECNCTHVLYTSYNTYDSFGRLRPMNILVNEIIKRIEIYFFNAHNILRTSV